MIGKSYVPIILAILLGLCVKLEARFTYVNPKPIYPKEDESKEEERIYISPKCAAVLITGGTLGGASLAYSIAPALCTAGFCQAGVTKASFAAWWQSTMPLIAGGSLFATLQSIAMGGVGSNVAVSGSVVGGGLGLTFIPIICAYVDDPDSSMASVFDANLAAVNGAKVATDKAKAACSSSETCSAAADFAQTTKETLSSSASSMRSYISESASQSHRAVMIWALDGPDGTIEGLKRKIQRYKDENRSREGIERLEKELKNKEARLQELKQDRG